MDLISGGVDWLGTGSTQALPPGPATGLLIEGILKGVGAVIVFLRRS